MTRTCDVCAGLDRSPPRGVAKRLRRIVLDERVIALCEEHHGSVRAAGVDSLEELRSLFVEERGKRSLVDRRAPLDRRLFPPRPEGRRRATGRRRTDATD